MSEKYPLALPVGSTLAGRYIIEKTLGQGGFGITYMASVYKTGERVAIKEFFPDTMATRQGTTVMPFNGEKGESFEYGKECFLKEAETLAQFIGVEGIVKIHTYFEENGTAYFVMDYVEGMSFDDYIKLNGGKVTYDVAESVLMRIIEALAVVHSKGIVHRDVTPDNIYITNDGSVKLLDFGAARYSLGDKSRSLDVVLKHGFAPKEQYTRHGKQGPFTDIYTVAASSYFAITGKRPPDSIDRIDEDDLVPPSVLGVDIPKEKENAILKAMSVQPGDRFQTMDEFKAALCYNSYANNSLNNQYQQQYNEQYNNYNNQFFGAAPVYQSYPVNTPPAGKKPPKWLIPVISAVCVLAIVLIVVFVGNSKKSSSNKKTTEEYASNTGKYDTTAEKPPKTETEYTTIATTTEAPKTTTELTTEAPVTCVVQGTFNTAHVNNESNCGLLEYDKNVTAISHPNGMMTLYNDNKLFIDTEGVSSINIINSDEIVYVKGGGGNYEAYVGYTDGSPSEKLRCLEGNTTIKTLIANEYGTFYAYEDTTKNICYLNYTTWDGSQPEYFYPYTPNTMTIIGDKIYWVDGTGKTLRGMELSKFGSAEADKLYTFDFPIGVMVGDGKYLYVCAKDDYQADNQLGRYDIYTGEFIFCQTVEGSTDNNYISSLNVKDGKVYYLLCDWQEFHSSIWCINSNESGWAETDYSCLWDSGDQRICIYGLSIDLELICFAGINDTDGAWKVFTALLQLENNEVTYSYQQ